MDEARVHQIIEANNDDLLKKMFDLIFSHVSASVKRPADDSVARRIKIKTADSRSVFKKKSDEEQCKAVSIEGS